MAMSILPKFLTLKWNISRTIRRIEVGHGSFFFCIFHTLSFELIFFRPEVPFKNIGQQKVGSEDPSHFTNLRCVRPIFEYGIVSTIPVSETGITKIQRVQNSFIRLALRLPKYVSACLLHEASGLPYIRERLITVGQNHLARMHANPLIEHAINSARINIAWDKYKTPISILKPLD